MNKVNEYRKEIIQVQEAGLLPEGFKFLETPHDKGAEVKSRLNTVFLNGHAPFLPMGWHSRVMHHRANTCAFWETLIDVVVGAVSDERINDLPTNCKFAINHAIAANRLPKNYVKTKQQQAAIVTGAPSQIAEPEPTFPAILVQYWDKSTGELTDKSYTNPEPMTPKDSIEHHSVPLPEDYIFVYWERPVKLEDFSSSVYTDARFIYVSGLVEVPDVQPSALPSLVSAEEKPEPQEPEPQEPEPQEPGPQEPEPQEPEPQEPGPQEPEPKRVRRRNAILAKARSLGVQAREPERGDESLSTAIGPTEAAILQDQQRHELIPGTIVRRRVQRDGVADEIGIVVQSTNAYELRRRKRRVIWPGSMWSKWSNVDDLEYVDPKSLPFDIGSFPVMCRIQYKARDSVYGTVAVETIDGKRGIVFDNGAFRHCYPDELLVSPFQDFSENIDPVGGFPVPGKPALPTSLAAKLERARRLSTVFADAHHPKTDTPESKYRVGDRIIFAERFGEIIQPAKVEKPGSWWEARIEPTSYRTIVSEADIKPEPSTDGSQYLLPGFEPPVPEPPDPDDYPTWREFEMAFETFVESHPTTVDLLEQEPAEPVPTEPVPTEPVPAEPPPTEPVPTVPIPTEPVPTVPTLVEESEPEEEEPEEEEPEEEEPEEEEPEEEEPEEEEPDDGPWDGDDSCWVVPEEYGGPVDDEEMWQRHCDDVEAHPELYDDDCEPWIMKIKPGAESDDFDRDIDPAIVAKVFNGFVEANNKRDPIAIVAFVTGLDGGDIRRAAYEVAVNRSFHQYSQYSERLDNLECEEAIASSKLSLIRYLFCPLYVPKSLAELDTLRGDSMADLGVPGWVPTAVEPDVEPEPELEPETESEKLLSISFGWVAERLPEKEVTRRTWSDKYAKRYFKACTEGRHCLAYDKAAYAHGKPVAIISLQAVYKEQLAKMPASDVAKEGFPELTKKQFVDRFFNCDDTKEVWVVRFKIVKWLVPKEDVARRSPASIPQSLALAK